MDGRPGERGGWIGAGIGYCSWAVALLLLTMSKGNWGAALDVGLPCLLLSLGLWGATVFAVHGAGSAFGARRPEARAVLLGSVFTSVGVLLLVANEYALPVLLQDPGMRQLLSSTGSATHLPAALQTASLALGASLLTWSVWRLLRRGPG